MIHNALIEISKISTVQQHTLATEAQQVVAKGAKLIILPKLITTVIVHMVKGGQETVRIKRVAKLCLPT